MFKFLFSIILTVNVLAVSRLFLDFAKFTANQENIVRQSVLIVLLSIMLVSYIKLIASHVKYAQKNL
ncbi:hypothetical protein DQG23_00070 [Paenibacillus contaminans]|uniref:Uncharacterized protein n=1 Tax=Paenibacillus contaminans TaxID=450362 RepID=A0A329MRQ4_9BACL|nr:hypothetical protein DQG23_00070 [Paenibacillus contaminans]